MACAEYCNCTEHLVDYSRFSKVYDRFRILGIIFPQEVAGMFDSDFWGQPFNSMDELNRTVARVQIWAAGMLIALYQLGMFDGFSYQELAFCLPSTPGTLLYRATNHYWACEFDNTYHLANMNNRNSPSPTPESSRAPSPTVKEEPQDDSIWAEQSVILLPYLHYCDLDEVEHKIFMEFATKPHDVKEHWAFIRKHPTCYKGLHRSL